MTDLDRLEFLISFLRWFASNQQPPVPAQSPILRVRAEFSDSPIIVKGQLPMSFRIATNQSIVLRLTASDRAQQRYRGYLRGMAAAGLAWLSGGRVPWGRLAQRDERTCLRTAAGPLPPRAEPDAGPGEFTDFLNPESLRATTAWVEPALAEAAHPETGVQFERIGYFTADRWDSSPATPVFNRTVTLRDSWAKQEKKQG